MKILVTGGAGFIGSAVIRHIIRNTDSEVVNVDKLTFVANPLAVEEAADNPRYAFEQVDIVDGEALRRVFSIHRPDAVMHLAAESHVDRSIDGPSEFIQTNLIGTYMLLETAREYWTELEAVKQRDFRFHHISTDEVFGSLGATGAFTESSVYKPNSPYSASKAGSDHLVRAWHKTYGLPVVTSNCSNNYGPWQFPEKLMPVVIMNALDGNPIPIYGTGENVRDWLYVDDHANALWTILTRGRVGETYNVGGNCERSNVELVKALCAIVDRLVPNPELPRREALMTTVDDRLGHDLRYAVDTSKIERELGWTPKYDINRGLEDTARWYIDNEACWRNVRGIYGGESSGSGKLGPGK